MKKVSLNANETKVLERCIEAIYGDNGAEFDVPSVDGLTDNQVKGYLSQLQQKGFINMYPYGHSYADGEVWLTPDGKMLVEGYDHLIGRKIEEFEVIHE